MLYVWTTSFLLTDAGQAIVGIVSELVYALEFLEVRPESAVSAVACLGHTTPDCVGTRHCRSPNT